ncbi:MAG: phosphodiester glycosidase family protein [Armatimonadota bacterium]
MRRQDGTTGRRGFARGLSLLCTWVMLGALGCRMQVEQTERRREVEPSPGVVVRSRDTDGSFVRVLEIDLRSPGLRVELAADDIAVREGKITGRARTVPEWLEETGAVAGVNGGFFGADVGEEFKEIRGLLKRDGRVRVAAPRYRSEQSGTEFARCALGFTREGEPRMAWVTSAPGDPQSLRAHPEPETGDSYRRWSVEQALACGPRLIRDGEVEVTYRGERLASPGALPRTFLGYGGKADRATHLVLCTAEAMEFEGCAEFLARYFREELGFPCRQAMCLDGGASTQAAWRDGSDVRSEFDYGTTVPTAILIHQQR